MAPDAITGYILEDVLNAQGAENSAAGHRRWQMRSTATYFATGDIPGFFDVTDLSTRRAAANVLYVVQHPGETASVAPAFVEYPPAGFFPAPLNTKFWSLTYPGANFGTATVSVTQVGGAAVTATIRNRDLPLGILPSSGKCPRRTPPGHFPGTGHTTSRYQASAESACPPPTAIRSP